MPGDGLVGAERSSLVRVLLHHRHGEDSQGFSSHL